jgi:peptidoglycan/LPS O-acetylase OafA/YrhL
MALVAFLGAILTAYAFYLLIERRFMTAYRRRGDDTGLRSAQATEIPDTAFAPASARQPG